MVTFVAIFLVAVSVFACQQTAGQQCTSNGNDVPLKYMLPQLQSWTTERDIAREFEIANKSTDGMETFRCQLVLWEIVCNVKASDDWFLKDENGNPIRIPPKAPVPDESKDPTKCGVYVPTTTTPKKTTTTKTTTTTITTTTTPTTTTTLPDLVVYQSLTWDKAEKEWFDSQNDPEKLEKFRTKMATWEFLCNITTHASWFKEGGNVKPPPLFTDKSLKAQSKCKEKKYGAVGKQFVDDLMKARTYTWADADNQYDWNQCDSDPESMMDETRQTIVDWAFLCGLTVPDRWIEPKKPLPKTQFGDEFKGTKHMCVEKTAVRPTQDPNVPVTINPVYQEIVDRVRSVTWDVLDKQFEEVKDNPNKLENFQREVLVLERICEVKGKQEWFGPNFTQPQLDCNLRNKKIIVPELCAIGKATTTTAPPLPLVDQDALKDMLEELKVNHKTIPQTLPFYLALLSKNDRSNLSWEADDLFQWASFEGQELELQKDIVKWNEATLGNCFTFNHMSKEGKFHLQVPGRKEGFRARMRVYQDQYLHWVEDAALLVFVHSSNQAVLGESLRFMAKPGTHTTLAITQTKFERLGGKYGKCVYDKEEVESYYFEGDYSIDGCFRSCYQDAVFKACGCMDPRFPRIEEQFPGCAMQKRKCVLDVSMKRGDPSTWEDCYCPLSCSNMQFTAQWSIADFTLKREECSNRQDNRTIQNCIMETDHVLLSVYVSNQIYQTFKEEAKVDFNKFISNLGGLLGILCGICIMTFFEFLFFIVHIGYVWICES